MRLRSAELALPRHILSRARALRLVVWVNAFTPRVRPPQVLALLRRFSHVRLSFHGHVHANSVTVRAGVAFVTTASVDEYPMTWREVLVRRCEVELRTHTLQLAHLIEKSAQREAGRGDPDSRNAAKRGAQADNNVIVRFCTRNDNE